VRGEAVGQRSGDQGGHGDGDGAGGPEAAHRGREERDVRGHQGGHRLERRRGAGPRHQGRRDRPGEGDAVRAAGCGRARRGVVRSSGELESKTALLLHGLGSSSFLYRKLISLLAAQELCAVAVDLLGAGLAEKLYLVNTPRDEC
jgi:pimeloyl-ACP methyl ester carboxylesterase